MIKTLSSYYLTIPLVSPLSGLTAESVELKLYVWNGDKTAPPTSETYKLTEPNPEALTNSIKVNIARLINDFIDFEPQVLTTNLQDGNNQVWVKSELYYNTEDAGEISAPQNTLVQLALKGYGFALEGINPQTPTDKLLLTNREFKVARNSKFIVPVIAEESAPPQAGSITVTNVTFDALNNDYIITFNAVGNYSGFTVDASNQFQQFVKGVNQTTSPINVGLDFVNSFGIEFDLFLVGFDNDSGQNIQSNTFNYIE
jgi:hypothetical protein